MTPKEQRQMQLLKQFQTNIAQPAAGWAKARAEAIVQHRSSFVTGDGSPTPASELAACTLMMGVSVFLECLIADLEEG